MKKISAIQVLLICFISTFIHSQQTVLIDFGDVRVDYNPSSSYNTIVYPGDTTTTISLVNDTGASTNFTYQTTDRFHSFTNGSGTNSPTGNATSFDNAALRDNFFGNDVVFSNENEPTGAFEISGLDNTKLYSFEVVASRTSVSDNREALYTIAGVNTVSGLLDASNNHTNTVLLTDVQPNAGSITITVSKGPNNTNSSGFYYIGAIKMVETTPLDSQPPTAPTLSSSGQTATTVDLSWFGATDDVAVTGYNIYKDGVLETTLGNVTTYQIIGLTASTSYNFTVTALDAAGNESVASNILNIRTNITDDPLLIDLSGATATQRNDYNSSSYASLAIDGNINGNWYADTTIAATGSSSESWWRLDLGEEYNLSRIDIYNRTDCCITAIGGTKVYVGNIDSSNPADYIQVGNTLVETYDVQEVNFNATGRYILISQLDKVDNAQLVLAEVLVYGTIASTEIPTPPTLSSTSQTATTID
ncbi:galactose-binding domain-containing protein, partial [Hyunsoonleella pacifica]